MHYDHYTLMIIYEIKINLNQLNVISKYMHILLQLIMDHQATQEAICFHFRNFGNMICQSTLHFPTVEAHLHFYYKHPQSTLQFPTVEAHLHFLRFGSDLHILHVYVFDILDGLFLNASDMFRTKMNNDIMHYMYTSPPLDNFGTIIILIYINHVCVHDNTTSTVYVQLQQQLM
ncbi:hypothetical protein ACJX0J_022564 [Zea mays]